MPRQIFGALERPIDQAQSLHNEGYMALLGGDLVTAMRIMSSARNTLVDVSPVFAAVCDVDRAEVLRDAGHTIEAERILAHAATVFGHQRMPQSRGEAEYHLARSLLAHDPVRARPVAARAARRFRTVGNDSWAARAEAVRMRAELSGGQIMRTGHHVPAPRRVPARSDVEGASGELERFGFGSDAAALRMTHELWRARRHEVDAGPARVIRVPDTASMEVRLLAYEVRAARASARGRHGEARTQAAAGLAELSAWLSDFGSLDLQTSAVMQGNGLIRVGLDSAVKSGRPEVVFEWSEWARHMSMQVLPLRPPPDGRLAEDLAELRMLRSEGGDWQSDPRARDLRERMRERQWSMTGSAAIQPRATLDEVQAALDDETALLSYVFSGDSLIVLVVTSESVSMLPIDGWRGIRDALPALRSDLDMTAMIRGRMGEVVRRALDDRLSSFSRELLDRARRGGRRAAVRDHRPGSAGRHPLGDAAGASRKDLHPARVGLAVGSAAGRRGAAALSRIRGRSRCRPRRRGSRRRGRGVAAPRDRPGGDGRRCHVSVRAMWMCCTSPLTVGTRRTTRCSPDSSSPTAPCSDTTSIGCRACRPPWCCRPARPVARRCGGVRRPSGMARAWLHAGTRCVIAAPVVVADDVACELLGAMHDGLAAGEPPSVALAAASDRTGIVAPFQAHGSGF